MHMMTGEGRLGMAGGVPVGPKFRKSVFISHSSKDAELVVRLRGLCCDAGIGCWQAPRSCRRVCPMLTRLSRASRLPMSELLASRSAVFSPTHVMNEVEQAQKREKRIGTLLIGKPKVTKRTRLLYLPGAATPSAGSDEELADRVVKAGAHRGFGPKRYVEGCCTGEVLLQGQALLSCWRWLEWASAGRLAAPAT